MAGVSQAGEGCTRRGWAPLPTWEAAGTALLLPAHSQTRPVLRLRLSGTRGLPRVHHTGARKGAEAQVQLPCARLDCRARPSHRLCTYPRDFAILYLRSLIHCKKGKKTSFLCGGKKMACKMAYCDGSKISKHQGSF